MIDSLQIVALAQLSLEFADKLPSPARGAARDVSRIPVRTDAAMTVLLLASHDAEQLRAAVRTDALHGGATVLHGHFLRLGHFLLRFALHTIRFSHGTCLPFGSSFTWKTCGVSYWQRPISVKVQNRDKMIQ
jgi:hypothetical protein